MAIERWHLWILGAGLGCFAAGAAAGLILPEVVRACCRDGAATDPDEDYVQQMASDFDLTSHQQQVLRIVMQRYKEEELQVYRHANFDQLPAQLQQELTAARRRWSQRIRALMTPPQQQRFDAKAGPTGTPR